MRRASFAVPKTDDFGSRRKRNHAVHTAKRVSMAIISVKTSTIALPVSAGRTPASGVMRQVELDAHSCGRDDRAGWICYGTGDRFPTQPEQRRRPPREPRPRLRLSVAPPLPSRQRLLPSRGAVDLGTIQACSVARNPFLVRVITVTRGCNRSRWKRQESSRLRRYVY